MTFTGKWIEGIGPESSISEAARISLEARLDAVIHWLPPAAYCPEQDVEHVHRLRVSTRRAVAALRLYRRWLPRRSARWILRQLKQIRRAAGDARDLDVLADRLQRHVGDRLTADNAAPIEALAEIAARRSAAQPAIVEVADACRRKERFARHVDRLLRRVKPRGGKHRRATEDSFGVWAQKRLTKAATSFFAAAPACGCDAEALHQFRIRAKSLRYSLELLAPALGSELREVHYPLVEELQERLGRINDHAGGAERLRHWSAEQRDPSQPNAFEELARDESERLAAELREFFSWWTPERSDELRSGLLREAEVAPVQPRPDCPPRESRSAEGSPG
jgi:CHAD domain-containing protein